MNIVQQTHYDSLSGHLNDVHQIARISAFIFAFLCIFWSVMIDDLVQEWLSYIPVETGPTNENLSIYGPFDWIEIRLGIVIMASLTTMLPIFSTQLYRYSKPALYPRERNWLISILVLSTTIVPLSIIAVWIIGTPIFFEFAIDNGTNDALLVRYDAASVTSIALGLSWILVIWSITTICLCMTRIFGFVVEGSSRFRYRLLAISSGILILTLPIEFDGLRLLISALVVISADLISRTSPVAMPIWNEPRDNDAIT